MSTDWNPKSCQRTSLPHARFPSPLHHSTSQQLVWLQLPSTSFSAVSSQAPASMVFAISSAWSLLTFTWAALYFPNVIGSWRFMDPRHTHTHRKAVILSLICAIATANIASFMILHGRECPGITQGVADTSWGVLHLAVPSVVTEVLTDEVIGERHV